MTKLTDEFLESELEWKPQSVGEGSNGVWAMVLCYVSARAIQNRLDEVFGALGWRDSYRFEKNGVICELSVYDNDKQEWISKENGSPETDIESFKGGISSAFKRVASSGFGIGRYLYELDTVFAEVSQTKVNGWTQAKTKRGTKFWWQAPSIKKAKNKTLKEERHKLVEEATMMDEKGFNYSSMLVNEKIDKSVEKEKSPTTKYPPKPASDKQKSFLSKLNVDFTESITLEEASQLIEKNMNKPPSKNPPENPKDDAIFNDLKNTVECSTAPEALFVEIMKGMIEDAPDSRKRELREIGKKKLEKIRSESA